MLPIRLADDVRSEADGAIAYRHADGQAVDGATNLPPPTALSGSAIFWSLVLGAGLAGAKLKAAHALPHPWMVSAAAIIASVAVGKAIATWSSNLKSYRIDQRGTRTPILVWVRDYFANGTLGLVNKLGMLAVLYGVIWIVVAGTGLHAFDTPFTLALLATWMIYGAGRAGTYYTSVRRLAAQYVQFRGTPDYVAAIRFAPGYHRVIQRRIVTPVPPIAVQFLILIGALFPMRAIQQLFDGFGWDFDKLPWKFGDIILIIGPG